MGLEAGPAVHFASLLGPSQAIDVGASDDHEERNPETPLRFIIIDS